MTSSPEMRDVDTSKAHSARMYDYYLGGTNHFAVDEEAAAKVARVWPAVMTCAQENRAYMHRVTRVLVREHGIRQWLDIGTGIPTEPNLHQVAQSLAPEARIVYVDHDPLVLTYAQTLVRSTPEGRIACVLADFNDPEAILNAPEVEQVLDLSEPVALSLNALLHFVTDAQDPYGTLNQLLDALPSGSVLTLSHSTADFDPATWEKIVQIYYASGTPFRVRDKDEVTRFFDGLDLVEPGVEVVHRWRPDAGEAAEGRKERTDAEISLWGGVGIKR
ncbi:SAM-dependent methyltransferase [Streptomyces sp. TS71-3]|uniref:SAM-dependent methyltransferase n=1 Tax=Streptomyces sp. TS71-3 TaxID=2733862 RepID=UPI001B1EFAF7|nr:SAM-dependent methyltransferase [Streptomyces sp. TS71-3]GHJ37537.1 hypothetical protein Sm713_31460 [Streptomyces sp. TS71-3]